MNNVLITTSSFDKAGESLLGQIKTAGYQPILNPFKRRLNESEAKNLLDEYKPIGIIAGVEPLTRPVLNLGAKGGLRVVSRCGIGMDSVDLQAAKDHDIRVFNTPDGPTRAVSELVLGQILCLLRGIHTSHGSVKAGEWERPMGRLLHGKTVGLVGCGRIGNAVADLLIAFGCRVIGTDPYSTLRQPAEMVSMDTLLRESDIVSLHLPYSKSNHHLMGSKQLQQMKPGSFLINCARGGLVDEQALVTQLSNGELAGAAVDTFFEEPYVGPLATVKNILLTAHIGSYARESRAMMERDATQNLIAALCSKKTTQPVRQS